MPLGCHIFLYDANLQYSKPRSSDVEVCADGSVFPSYRSPAAAQPSARRAAFSTQPESFDTRLFHTAHPTVLCGMSLHARADIFH